MKPQVRAPLIILLALKCSTTFGATLRDDTSPTNQNLYQNYAVAGLFLNNQQGNLTGNSQVLPDAAGGNAYGFTSASSHTEFAPQHVRFAESSYSIGNFNTGLASSNSFARFITDLIVDPGPGENIGDPVSVVVKMTLVTGPNPEFEEGIFGEGGLYGIAGTLNALGTPITMAELGMGAPITVNGHIGDAVSFLITTGTSVDSFYSQSFGPYSADMTLDVTIASVPEPSGMVLLALGGLTLVLWPRIKTIAKCANGECRLTLGRVTMSESSTFSLGIAAGAMFGSLVLASLASASVVDAFNGPPSGGDLRTDALAQAGYGFYATTAGTRQVNELGFWVAPTNTGAPGELAVSHEVGLYNYTGVFGLDFNNYTQIADAIVPAGSVADIHGYAWVSIPTITLTDTRQGADYYVVEASQGTDPWTPNFGAITHPVLDASFGTPTGNGAYTGTAFPGVGGITGFAPFSLGNGGFVGGNIGFVPEPSSFILCGLGVLGLLVASRRRRKA